jgi:peptidase E
MEPDNPLLDRYVLDATGKPRPKVCFFPHAGDFAMPYALKFFEAFTQYVCQPTWLSLFQTPPRGDLEAFILSHDAIYVGGGNTKSMLALWRGWGLDIILRKAYEQGVVLAGISAGANCWFEDCVTDSAAPQLSALGDGLGLLKGSFCPHYDGEAMRRPIFHRLIANGEIKDGIACDDGAAAHFVDGALVRVVGSRPNAKGYRLTRGADGEAIERKIETQFLGVA